MSTREVDEHTKSNMDPPKATPKSSVSTMPRTTGPTPQSNEKRRRSGDSMSPTDSLVSPCTEKLMKKRTEPGGPQDSISPTDSMVSPCTKKLMKKRRKQGGPQDSISPTDSIVSPCTEKLMKERTKRGGSLKLRGRRIQSISKPSKLDVSKVGNKAINSRSQRIQKQLAKDSSIY